MLLEKDERVDSRVERNATLEIGRLWFRIWFNGSWEIEIQGIGYLYWEFKR